MKPKLITGDIHYDNRGFLIFSNEFKFNIIQRFYIVSNFQNKFVRAWHGHKKESKFIMCIQGSFQISCVKIKNFKKTI
jgi:dTDP-4-dehydrorhamnose 3,5-epimerase